jgi:hypothetical protein
VLKLDPTGQKILYRTLIGGAPEALAVDAAGNVLPLQDAAPGRGRALLMLSRVARRSQIFFDLPDDAPRKQLGK